jgi:hypothetical protein
MMRCIVVLVIAAPLGAAADPIADDLSTTRSQIGWGATVNPDRVNVWSQGGWDGGVQRAVVSATAEATVYPRASIVVNTSIGETSSNPRPSVGAAYQLIDPRSGVNGARVSLTYKPEGFTEPDGEFESVLVLSRRIAGNALRAMVAYGRDAEGKESDVEVGTSLVHRIASSFIVGGTARYRRGIAIKVGEPRWDTIGGAIGGVVRGRARFEVLVGADAVTYTVMQTGIVGLMSVGIDL